MAMDIKKFPIYEKPSPHYLWEDLRLALGVLACSHLHAWLERENRNDNPDGVSPENIEAWRIHYLSGTPKGMRRGI